MLPLTGPDARGYREPLEWAVGNVNDAGGPAGRDLELVYADLGATSVAEATRRFAADRSIVAVIGPDTSDRFFAAAPALIAASHDRRLADGDIRRRRSGRSRALATCGAPCSPTSRRCAPRSLLVARDGTHRVAVVAGTDHYGTTFSDWFGFHAQRARARSPSRSSATTRQQDCAPAVERALAAEPDALLAAARDEANAACIARAWSAGGAPGRLLFTDAAQAPGLLDELGTDADGLEGLGLGEDPDAGFSARVQTAFGHPPDEGRRRHLRRRRAARLRAPGVGRRGRCRAQRGDGQGGRRTRRPDRVGRCWHRRRAAALDDGGRPDVNGAAGPLHFDEATHTDLLSGTYVHWQVEGGRFRSVEQLSTGPARPGTSDARVTALDSLEANFRATSGHAHEPPVAKDGLWALLVATSRGWDNYRHQADVFAQYQMLRAAGVPAERIIVVAEDDVARTTATPDRDRCPTRSAAPTSAPGCRSTTASARSTRTTSSRSWPVGRRRRCRR